MGGTIKTGQNPFQSVATPLHIYLLPLNNVRHYTLFSFNVANYNSYMSDGLTVRCDRVRGMCRKDVVLSRKSKWEDEEVVWACSMMKKCYGSES